jgi:O-antigen/teichoic acid export membrane protein
MSQSRVQKSIYNMITGVIGQVIVLVTGFVVRTVFIRSLGSTYLGISGLFGNILNILSFAELGIGQAIIFSLYKPIAEHDEDKICSLMNLYKQVYHALFWIVLVLGVLILPILPFIINDIETIPYIRIIYVMYVFNSASSYLFIYKNAFLTANQQNYISTLISYGFSFGTSIIQIIALVVFKNYLLYLGIQISSTIINNIVVAHKVDKLYPFLKRKNISKLDSGEFNTIKNNVKALVIYKIGTLSLNSTDNILISKFVGLVTVGLYSNYLLISQSVTGFLATIFSNLTASIGNLNASESKERQQFMFNVINLATFWLYGVVAICIYNLIDLFIGECWLGENYILGRSSSFIIAFNIYIAGMLFAPFNYRQTMGLFVEGKVRPIISALENVIVSIILGKYFGLNGILWGTAITRLTTNAWYDPYVVCKKGLKVNPFRYFMDYIIKLVILFMTGALCECAINFIMINGIVGWLIKAAITFILCNLIFFAFYCKTKEFKYLLNIAKNMKQFIKNK